MRNILYRPTAREWNVMHIVVRRPFCRGVMGNKPGKISQIQVVKDLRDRETVLDSLGNYKPLELI